MVAFFPFFIRLFRWIVDIGNLVVLHGYGLTLKAYLYISTTPLLFGNAEKQHSFITTITLDFLWE